MDGTMYSILPCGRVVMEEFYSFIIATVGF